MIYWIIVTLIVSVALVLWFMCHNLGNKEIVFATATVVSAAVFYGLQVFLGLSESKKVAGLMNEITIDRSTRFAGAHLYTLNQSHRAAIEREAVEKVAQAHPESLNYQEEILCKDLLVFSTLEWLVWEEFDWQLEAKSFRMSDGTLGSRRPTSLVKKSTVLKVADLRKALSASGNMFADHFSGVREDALLLPKNSKVTIGNNSITISHPVFDLKIEFDKQPREISNANPLTRKMEILPNGRPRNSKYAFEMTFTATIKRFRSGDIDRPRFETWFARLESDIQKWFEVPVFPANREKLSLGEVLLPEKS